MQWSTFIPSVALNRQGHRFIRWGIHFQPMWRIGSGRSSMVEPASWVSARLTDGNSCTSSVPGLPTTIPTPPGRKFDLIYSTRSSAGRGSQLDTSTWMDAGRRWWMVPFDGGATRPFVLRRASPKHSSNSVMCGGDLRCHWIRLELAGRGSGEVLFPRGTPRTLQG